MKVGHKYFPDILYVAVGDIFDRMPIGVVWVATVGTHPFYGRSIVGSKKVNDNKYELELGYIVDRVIIHDKENVSATATIYVYGEFAE